MFGPSILVAPIYTNCSANFSCTSRHVYLPALPAGETWTNVFTNQTAGGGSTAQNVSVSGERDTFPLFTRGVAPASIFQGKFNPLPEHYVRQAGAAAAAAVEAAVDGAAAAAAAAATEA